MKNLKLTIAYDGTSFYGWQKSRSGPTVEAVVQKALEKILNHPVTLQAASRTDRGVHARGQVVNLLTQNPLSLDQLGYSLNSLLPKSVVILSVEEERANFHPTLDVSSKEYLYAICNTQLQLPHHRFTSWHIPKPLDIYVMRLKAQEWIGEHDFALFCNRRPSVQYTSTIRTIDSIEIKYHKQQLFIVIKGKSFLYKMVRNLVGTLVDCGRGKNVKRGVCAPPHGLTLNCVNY
ncbi:MAG: tRNA pseudouridine synthase A [Chlamydiales bacterium]|nr:tRNA pseudouridine synthase A [Chlamydiales bacterium]MCH9620385.1 tRNA pseudouridine synthase A [Chlamydiales bacterium]MCH9622969.1 tRNA pseudouridine synthase A [Chlamydiales bacterium]